MTRKGFFFFFLTLIVISARAETDTINIQNLKSGITLEDFWRVHRGDNKLWADPAFVDSTWRIASNDSVTPLAADEDSSGITWYRTTFVIDSLIDNVPLGIELRVLGAIDIFYDGKLIRSIGT